MRASSHFLIVEDDALVGRMVERCLNRFRPCVLAESVRAAESRLSDPLQRWTALVVDIGLGDGSGFAIVEKARERSALLPVLMITGLKDRDAINRAQRLHAEYLVKPVPAAALEEFGLRAVALEHGADQRLTYVAAQLAARFDLTPRELEVVIAALYTNSREELRRELGVRDNTLKSLIRHVLSKTSYETLDALVKALLREALEVGAPRPNGDSYPASDRG